MTVWKAWPETLAASAGDWSPTHLRQLYELGFRGAYRDDEAQEQLNSQLEYRTYGDVCDQFNLWGSRVADGLYLPFLAVVACEGARLGISGSLPELSREPRIVPYPETQKTGDCVSHWARNGCDIVRAVEIYWTREPEEWRARTATEPIYGHRGHRGQGASCDRLLSYVMDVGGMMLRQEYDIPGFGKLDLSRYDASIGINWGGRGVPGPVAEVGQEHQIRQATRVTDGEQLTQAYRNGLAVGGCSSIAFSSERDENGVSRVQGSWAHAMQGIGFDERPETVRKYGGPLVLEQNSWGAWNRGPRRIMGTEIDIPIGSCWVRFQDYVRRKVSSGGCFAMAGAEGWQAQRFLDYGTNWLREAGW